MDTREIHEGSILSEELKKLEWNLIQLTYQMPLDKTGLHKNFSYMMCLYSKKVPDLDDRTDIRGNIKLDQALENIDAFCLYWVNSIRLILDSRLEWGISRIMISILLDLHEVATHQKEGRVCELLREGIYAWADERIVRKLGLKHFYGSSPERS